MDLVKAARHMSVHPSLRPGSGQPHRDPSIRILLKSSSRVMCKEKMVVAAKGQPAPGSAPPQHKSVGPAEDLQGLGWVMG